MSIALVSNFEVLISPITPIPPPTGSSADAAPAAPTMHISQIPRHFRIPVDDDAATFPVPQVIQGFFLLIGNPVTSPIVTPVITVEADPTTISQIVSCCLALTQIAGKNTVGKFTQASSTTATATLPSVSYGANFAIVGNYTSSSCQNLDLRGNVYITINAAATLVLTPQTRAIFTTGSTTPPGEVAYSMITPTGGSRFTFTTATADLFSADAKDAGSGS